MLLAHLLGFVDRAIRVILAERGLFHWKVFAENLVVSIFVVKQFHLGLVVIDDYSFIVRVECWKTLHMLNFPLAEAANA